MCALDSISNSSDFYSEKKVVANLTSGSISGRYMLLKRFLIFGIAYREIGTILRKYIPTLQTSCFPQVTQILVGVICLCLGTIVCSALPISEFDDEVLLSYRAGYPFWGAGLVRAYLELFLK